MRISSIVLGPLSFASYFDGLHNTLIGYCGLALAAELPRRVSFQFQCLRASDHLRRCGRTVAQLLFLSPFSAALGYCRSLGPELSSSFLLTRHNSTGNPTEE